MPLYHLLLDADLFHHSLRPALAASWRRRSFEPCRPLYGLLRPQLTAFAERYPHVLYYTPTNEPYICATFGAELAIWYPFLRGDSNAALAIKNVTEGVCRAMAEVRQVRPDARMMIPDTCEYHHAPDGAFRDQAAFRTERARPSPDLPGTVPLNQKVHFAIYHAAGSPMLVEIITGLWLKAGPILSLDMATNFARVSSGTGERYHAAALAAIRAGDAAGARAAIVGDIEQACEYIVSLGKLPGG